MMLNTGVYMDNKIDLEELVGDKEEAIRLINDIALLFMIDVDVYEEV